MKYSLSSRILHWSMAAIIIFLLWLGIYMSHFLSKEATNRMDFYNLHKSLGVLILALIFVRIINRFIKKPPALPNSLPKWEIFAAQITHFLLYLSMILIPLSGYLMSNSFGYAVKFFGIKLPFLVKTNFDLGKIFSEIHELAAYSLIGLIVFHIAGALKHRFFDKKENDVLNRMI